MAYVKLSFSGCSTFVDENDERELARLRKDQGATLELTAEGQPKFYTVDEMRGGGSAPEDKKSSLADIFGIEAPVKGDKVDADKPDTPKK